MRQHSAVCVIDDCTSISSELSNNASRFRRFASILNKTCRNAANPLIVTASVNRESLERIAISLHAPGKFLDRFNGRGNVFDTRCGTFWLVHSESCSSHSGLHCVMSTPQGCRVLHFRLSSSAVPKIQSTTALDTVSVPHAAQQPEQPYGAA